jgi:hypothetical protein
VPDQTIDIQPCATTAKADVTLRRSSPVSRAGSQHFDAMIAHFLTLSVAPGSMGEHVVNKERG